MATITKTEWITKVDEAVQANKDVEKAREAFLKAADVAGAADLAAKKAKAAWKKTPEAQAELKELQS